jgi:archaellum component FlaF (FlaF/FlaG flagellin family)
MAGLGGTYNQPFSVPGYVYVPPSAVTVNVTVSGSVVAEQELVQVVADALVVANTQGLNVRRPGAIGFKVDEG